MSRPHGCRAGRPPESPSPAPGAPSDDTTVLEAHPRRAARRVASALRRYGAVLVLTLAALAAPLSTAQAQSSVLSTTTISDSGTYAIGATITLTVVFTAAVSVSGTPQLALDVGGETRQVDYASGSGTQVLEFSYTVAEGDEDTDGISVISDGLTLNGGTISAGGTAANLTGVGPISFTGILVDGIRPTLDSATVAEDGTSIDLVFDEPYDNIGFAGLITLGAPPSVTADGSSVTVGQWVAPVDADGKRRRLELKNLSATITHGQVVTVSYNDPTTGDDVNVLQDEAGNDVASFTTGSDGVPAVVNNSTVTPAGAPQNVVAEAFTGRVTLNWDAPASDGGSPITHYDYRLQRGTGSFGAWDAGGGHTQLSTGWAPTARAWCSATLTSVRTRPSPTRCAR